MLQHQQLQQALAELKVTATDAQIKKLLQYASLLQKWNAKFNLTAIKDAADILNLHLVDSASIVPYVTRKHNLDVGTGGGLPGVVLAILLPKQNFTLLDSNGKKTRFLLQVKQILELDNIVIVNSRVESYKTNDKFDAIISRAFTSIDNFTQQTAHLLAINGEFLAMKAIDETDNLTLSEYKTKTIPITLPNNTDLTRNLVVISN